MTRRTALVWMKPLLGVAICLSLLDSRAAKAAEWTVVDRTEHNGYVLYEPPLLQIFWLEMMPPVVVYLHGAPGLVQPDWYDSAARDLAEAGCVVVLPIYNGLPWDWYDDAVVKTRRALDDIANGRLVELNVPGLQINRTLRAVWPRRSELSRLAAALLATLPTGA